MEVEKNYFQVLNDVNVNDKTEKKNGLTYLSWAWAWGEVKKRFPNTIYTVYENDKGWNYFTDGNTCWVKTGVTVEGIEHIEYLPVMDFRNKSIPQASVTSFDVNKAIQRSLTKALARQGLGLYIYAGEDLPENEPERVEREVAIEKTKIQTINKPKQIAITELATKSGSDISLLLTHYGLDDVSQMTEEQFAKAKATYEERLGGK